MRCGRRLILPTELKKGAQNKAKPTQGQQKAEYSSHFWMVEKTKPSNL